MTEGGEEVRIFQNILQKGSRNLKVATNWWNATAVAGTFRLQSIAANAVYKVKILNGGNKYVFR